MTDHTPAPADSGRGVAVQLLDLHRWYGAVHALDGLTIDIAPGELVALLGPSGCGKTTALRALGGLDEIDAGRIVVDGKDMTRRPCEQARHGHRLPGLQPVPEHDLARQRCLRAATARRRARPTAASEPVTMLELVGLGTQADRYPYQMSGGQQQRVALARALAIQPEGAAARRAAVRARRQGPPAAARGDPADPDRGRNDDAVRDPRPGGGAGARRSRRRHVGRPARADRRAGRALRPPGDRLRRRVRRAHQPAARRRAATATSRSSGHASPLLEGSAGPGPVTALVRPEAVTPGGRGRGGRASARRELPRLALPGPGPAARRRPRRRPGRGPDVAGARPGHGRPGDRGACTRLRYGGLSHPGVPETGPDNRRAAHPPLIRRPGYHPRR